MSYHKDYVGLDIHVGHRWEYANASARTSDSGFVTGDLKCTALQLDNNTTWLLTATTPTWVQIGGLSGLLPSSNLSDVADAGTARTNLGLGTSATHSSTDFVLASSVGANSGVAQLDSGGHVPVAQLPASVVGALEYQGTWNANTNSPTLADGTGTQGFYYKVSTAGATSLDGNAGWHVGDLAIFDGTVWDKVDNYEAVVTVAGRTGAIVLGETDITGLVADLAAKQPLLATTAPTITTGSIADTVADNTQVLAVGHAGIIGALSVDRSAYVRIYATAADQAADTRTAVPSDGGYVPPGGGADTVPGLLFEYWFAPGSLSPTIRPFAYYDPSGDGLPVSVTNTSGTTGTVTLTAALQQLIS